MKSIHTSRKDKTYSMRYSMLTMVGDRLMTDFARKKGKYISFKSKIVSKVLTVDCVAGIRGIDT